MIDCLKLKKKSIAMKRPPFPGELGKKIFGHISQEAWDLWKNRQIMFINEHRLNLLDPQAKQFLQDQMEAFLFDDQDIKPEGYTQE